MVRNSSAETLSAHVAQRLKDDILNGRWMPGAKLQVVQLSEHYETSSTVVREALMRLAGEQLVQFRPNRGFFVKELSLDELGDLTELRCRAEEYGIALALERGSLAWESDLIASHHTLSRTPRRAVGEATRISNDWYAAHRAFHAKLIEACGLPMLIELAGNLADATALYRIWAAQAPHSDPRDIDAEHQAILDAALARDAELAGRLLREHYTKTMDVIRSSGLVDSAAPADDRVAAR